MVLSIELTTLGDRWRLWLIHHERLDVGDISLVKSQDLKIIKMNIPINSNTD